MKKKLYNEFSYSRRQFLTTTSTLSSCVYVLSLFPYHASSTSLQSPLAEKNEDGVGKDGSSSAILFEHDIGFNGMPTDPATHGYLLGNGYRVYNTELQRYMSPDSWSPFGEGGVNPYAYCSGDPVNQQDPTGHIEVNTLLFGLASILGGVAAILTAPLTGGSSAVIYANAIGGAMGVASGSLKTADAFVSDAGVSKNLAIASASFGLLQTFSGVGTSVMSGLLKSKTASGKNYYTNHKLVRRKSTQQTIEKQRTVILANYNKEKDLFRQGVFSQQHKALYINGKARKNYKHSSRIGLSIKTTRSATTLGGTNKLSGTLIGMGGAGLSGGTNITTGLISFAAFLYGALSLELPPSSDNEEGDSIRSSVFME